MEKPKTYIELLAENDSEARKEFEHNAKELFLEHQEYEDDVDPHGKEHDELEDQEAFQRYQGSHQQAAMLGELGDTKASSTTAVQYDKAVQVHVISIDSRFRTNLLESQTNFNLKLLAPIKNVVSIRLSSLEIPNTWYVISEERGNNSLDVEISDSVLNPLTGISFKFSKARIILPSGNYSLSGPNSILTALSERLNEAFPYDIIQFGVSINPYSSLISIFCETVIEPKQDVNFILDFTQGKFGNRNFNFGLGFNLGFANKRTESNWIHTANYIPDLIDSNYIFLNLNPDWKVVTHRNPDNTVSSAFAKVIINSVKNDVVFDNGSNTITKLYTLKQPSNISEIPILITDEYNQQIITNGGSVSLTLELTEVLNSKLYELHRN